MRTTITLDDHVLAEAKVIAARSGRTLSRVVEDALREQLARRREAAVAARADFSLPTFGDPAGQLLVDLADKDAVARALGDEAVP
ncbi:MAG TPA: type II toxin-antitoxin system VapB family antitoxin [Dermatophilaceae bacterium]|nr:type II toxin-antitoxin system VapB family antitoxin [Dermatophilaceae bacterium]